MAFSIKSKASANVKAAFYVSKLAFKPASAAAVTFERAL